METLKALSEDLRGRTTEDKFSLIMDAIKRDHRIGLSLANAHLRDSKYFYSIMDIGLDTADAHSMRSWLDCIVPRIGVKRVLHRLIKQMDKYPVGVSKTLYWLPSYVSETDEKANNIFLTLMEKASDKGIVRNRAVNSTTRSTDI